MKGLRSKWLFLAVCTGVASLQASMFFSPPLDVSDSPAVPAVRNSLYVTTDDFSAAVQGLFTTPYYFKTAYADPLFFSGPMPTSGWMGDFKKQLVTFLAGTCAAAMAYYWEQVKRAGQDDEVNNRNLALFTQYKRLTKMYAIMYQSLSTVSPAQRYAGIFIINKFTDGASLARLITDASNPKKNTVRPLGADMTLFIPDVTPGSFVNATSMVGADKAIKLVLCKAGTCVAKTSPDIVINVWNNEDAQTARVSFDGLYKGAIEPWSSSSYLTAEQML